MLKESWKVQRNSRENLISYILSVKEKLEKMTELAQQNLLKAQRHQKEGYDKNSRS